MFSVDVAPYLTLSITQSLSLPVPVDPEPKEHHSVNALIDARARKALNEKSPRPAVGFTDFDRSSRQWRCDCLTYPEIQGLGIALAIRLREKLASARRFNSKSHHGTPLVAVLSPSGLDLFGHILALWRLGFGVLCIAPGSPPEAIANLLRLTATSAILAHPSQLAAAREGLGLMKDDVSAPRVEVMDMECDVKRHLVDAGPSPCDTDGLAALLPSSEDVLVTMHTSGSSGLPKPIYQPHRFWTQSMTTAAGTELSAFTTTPLFHGGMSDFLRSLQAGSTIFLHPAADPGALSASAIVQAVAACPTEVSYFLSVPYILEMLFSDPKGAGRTLLQQMELVSTGGAPLPQQVGDDMVNADIRLVSRLGSSECGFLMSSWRDFATDKEWCYLRVYDDLGTRMLHFEPISPGSFELVVDPSWPVKLVSNRADGAYATSDVYSPHPSKPHAWRYAARSDDTLVLTSGKKTTAPQLEAKLRSCDSVLEAIAFGANRPIIGALIFLRSPSSEQDLTFRVKRQALLQLKPAIDDYNRSAPPHAHLAYEMVRLFPASASADIPRASKGSLQRGRAYQQYEASIEQAYHDFEAGTSISLPDGENDGECGGDGKKALSGAALVDWLIACVEKLRDERSGKPIRDTTDFFVVGVDSIQAARIRAAIHQRIDINGQLLQKNVVYDYPTPRLLAKHIEETRQGILAAAQSDEEQHRLMLSLVEKYSNFKDLLGDGNDAPGTRDVLGGYDSVDDNPDLVVLTGVTGSLGAHIFDQLRSRRCSDVTYAEHGLATPLIICLIRARDDEAAFQRVIGSLNSRRLHASAQYVAKYHGSKVLCLATELSAPSCGLEPSALRKLAGRHRSVLTIHAAWAVNFVGSLQSFASEQIAGLHELLRLHRVLVGTNNAARPRSLFTFCSSVASILGAVPSVEDHGAVSSNNDSWDAYAEVLPRRPSTAAPMGYARSKWVAEHICGRFYEQSGDRINIMRIGQLCSDTKNGVWNETEAWPLLIRTADETGYLPILKDEKLAWLPVDVAAAALVDIDLGGSMCQEKHQQAAIPTADPDKRKEGVAVYHLVADESRAASWQQLLSWLSEEMDFTAAQAPKWLEALEAEEEKTKARGMLELWKGKHGRDPSPPAPTSFGADLHPQRLDQTRIDSRQAQAHSLSLRCAPPVDKELIRKSVESWRASGFLQPRSS